MRFLYSLVVILAMAIAMVSAQPAKPIFPNSYSVEGSVVMTQPNGPTQTGSGMSWWIQGPLGNLTAELNNPGQSFVADFDHQIVYYMDGIRNCQYTCALQDDTACDSQLNGESLCSYDYLHYAKYAGQSNINGQVADEWSYNDMLGPIVMASHKIWTIAGTNTPLMMNALFTPFGNLAGNATVTFSNFVAGNPPPSAFFVNQTEYCQDGGDNCSNVKSFHRNNIARLLKLKKFFTNDALFY